MAHTHTDCTLNIRTAAILTGLMTTTGLAHAVDNASVIYAAENALYGAGIDIGQADGWMDGALRSAIRQLQSRHGELAVNGTLDAATLEALGIDYAPAMAISENHVGSAKAARLALNLPGASVPAPRPQPVPKAKPIAEPPEETVATTPVTEPERGEVSETPKPVAVVADTEPADTDEQSPRPEEREVQIIAQSQPSEPARPVAAPDPISQLPTEPTSAGPAEPPREIATAEPKLVDEPTPVAAPMPAAASVVPAVPIDEPRESRGGFLASLFDFLFGWLI